MDPKLGPLGMNPALLAPDRPVPSRTRGDASMGEAFEAILLQQLFVSMRETVPKSGLFESSSSDGLYDHLVEQAMGEHLARSGGIGLAALFDEPSVAGQSEKLGRVPAWEAHAAGASSELRRGVPASIDHVGGYGGGRPLADELPPQDDPWLDQPGAATKLRALFGADEQ